MINSKKIIGIVIVLCMLIAILFSMIVVKGVNKKETLLGKAIYIDAGHGGKDDGASYGGVLEDEINLKIAGYIVGELIELGAYVLTSRTSDYDLSSLYDKNKKRADLINRVKQINASRVDIFVSIHLNSYASDKIKGGQVFYQNDENSKNLANYIQNRLNIISTSKDRKIKYGDYYILNKSKPTGVIVECGFLSNSEERYNLVTDEYQQRMAKSIVRGIIDYFNNVDNL